MEEGSLRGTVFLMVMSALGVGIFSLHHVFETTGLIPGFLLTLLVGFG